MDGASARPDERAAEYWRGLVAEGAAAGEAITAEWDGQTFALVTWSGSERWLEVVRVNRVSVTVPSSLGPWNDTLRMDQIDEYRAAGATL